MGLGVVDPAGGDGFVVVTDSGEAGGVDGGPIALLKPGLPRL